MNDFKLLAIRPLDGCALKYRRALAEDELYSFYAGFTAGNPLADVANRILTLTTMLPDGYYKLIYDNKTLSLNVSAIVGMNGSGKSSLTDLLFVAIYNFSVERRILSNHKRINPLCYEEDIHLEMFYQLNGLIYCLYMNSGKRDKKNRLKRITWLHRYRPAGNQWIYDSEVRDRSKIIANHFFYTVAVNYSLYGLNASQLGEWISSLFHKNDLYQTPVVINPFRDKGTIDINTENELVYQRLLANILTPVAEDAKPADTLRNLASSKVANYLELKLNKGKIAEYHKQFERKPIKNGIDAVGRFYFRYTGTDVLNYSLQTIEHDIVTYIMYKLSKICRSYDRYHDFYKKDTFVDLDYFVERLIQDDSHVTFKLKQAANLLRHYKRIQQTLNSEGKIDITAYAKYVKETIDLPIGNLKRKLRPIELIPPTLYDIRIRFNDHHSFDDLSSGEKQKIYGINSIVYHLINLNSVFESKANEEQLTQNHYPFINIVFDEIELYFHPDFQRRFIADLVAFLQKMNPEHVWFFKGINVLFITHSPFILSDIPTDQVLYLEVDKIGAARPVRPKGQTLGGNIHSLLADEFFMKDSLMGELIRQKIKSAIGFLNDVNEDQAKWDPVSVKAFIELIGEPLIRKSMLDLYFQRYGRDALQKEIDRLNKIMEGMA